MLLKVDQIEIEDLCVFKKAPPKERTAATNGIIRGLAVHIRQRFFLLSGALDDAFKNEIAKGNYSNISLVFAGSKPGPYIKTHQPRARTSTHLGAKSCLLAKQGRRQFAAASLAFGFSEYKLYRGCSRQLETSR